MIQPFTDALKIASAVGIIYLICWVITATLELGVLRYIILAISGE